ncbi:MAG TPA: hypothetical protein VOB72_14535 [Candidatus Dormibacteraeota bacterium]|nr:hypothetical protein [Candidatus Dormibacteraeota bacterium]
MTLDREAAGRLFRTAWVEGVGRHHPGTPREGHLAAWEELSGWERDSSATVGDQIAQLVVAANGRTSRLTRAQRGQFVVTCWIAQVHRHLSEPSVAAVTPWEELPEWQRQTVAHVFDVIERAVNEQRDAGG